MLSKKRVKSKPARQPRGGGAKGEKMTIQEMADLVGVNYPESDDELDAIWHDAVRYCHEVLKEQMEATKPIKPMEQLQLSN